jgi:hypothetical protein
VSFCSQSFNDEVYPILAYPKPVSLFLVCNQPICPPHLKQLIRIFSQNLVV